MSPPPKTRAARGRRPRVALFVTCLADLFRPSVAFASLALLKAAGCRVNVPGAQTCCGQPGYNSGDYPGARAVAKRVIELFESADYVVAPSGSCTGMITRHYPRLLEGEWRARAQALANRTWEISTFLTEVMPLPQADDTDAALRHRRIAYHDGCAGLRELGIREQPRALLREQAGVEVLELDKRDVCCGFGGTFCAKMPEISGTMASDKLRDSVDSGADMLVGGDLGCLLSLAGRASREGIDLEFRHVVELLYTQRSKSGIGESAARGAGSQ
ncbi:MAG: (Fe-S)-binding protein [Chromatocurvus sp.]